MQCNVHQQPIKARAAVGLVRVGGFGHHVERAPEAVYIHNPLRPVDEGPLGTLFPLLGAAQLWFESTLLRLCGGEGLLVANANEQELHLCFGQQSELSQT